MNKEKIDPKLDLVLERVLDVPADLIWKVWTEPEHLKPWFCPKPWKVTECRIDLRPGGEFFTTMKGPEAGQEFPNAGCYLEVEKDRRLSWTSALGPEFRPVNLPAHAENEGAPPFHFTATLILTPERKGTRYTAIAKHADPEGAKIHEKMGFQEGWGTVADQMTEYIKAGLKVPV